jgi:hypothetical protein
MNDFWPREEIALEKVRAQVADAFMLLLGLDFLS